MERNLTLRPGVTWLGFQGLSLEFLWLDSGVRVIDISGGLDQESPLGKRNRQLSSVYIGWHNCDRTEGWTQFDQDLLPGLILQKWS